MRVCVLLSLAVCVAVPQPRFEPVDHPAGGPRWQALDDFWLASERERVERVRSQHDRYGNTPSKLAVESGADGVAVDADGDGEPDAAAADADADGATGTAER